MEVLRRIKARTIWAPTALLDIQHRYRGIYRVGLPVVDGLFILLGIAGAIIGSRVIVEATFPLYNLFWSLVIGLSAATALVGLAFQLSWTEMLAKISLVVSVVWYAVLLAGNGIEESPSAALSVIIALGFTCIPIWRITDLIPEIVQQELEKENRQ